VLKTVLGPEHEVVLNQNRSCGTAVEFKALCLLGNALPLEPHRQPFEFPREGLTM
jgi:hypothetical protein